MTPRPYVAILECKVRFFESGTNLIGRGVVDTIVMVGVVGNSCFGQWS